MAIFNDAPNPVDPTNFIGWSKEIQQPKSDNSTGLLLQGAGKALDIGANVADTFVKSSIENSLYKQIDEKRDGLISDLKSFGNKEETPPAQPGASNDVGPQTSRMTSGYPTQESLLPTNITPPNIPNQIQTGLSRASVLGQASASKPDLQALYDAQLDAIAKNMRTQFPGYRPYIDAQMSQISGKNPANSEVNALLDAYNKNMAMQKTEQEKPANMLRENIGMVVGGTRASDLLNAYLSNPNAPGAAAKVYNFLGAGLAYKYNFDQKNTQHTLTTNEQAEDLEQAKRTGTYTAEHHVATTLSDLSFHFGTGADGTSADLPLSQVLQEVNSGKRTLSPEDLSRLPGIINAAKNHAMGLMDVDFNTKPKDGSDSLSVRLGNSRAELKAVALKKFDDYEDMLTNAGHGAATFVARFTKLQNDNNEATLYNNSQYGQYFQAMKVITGTGAPKEVTQPLVDKIMGDASKIPGNTQIAAAGNMFKLAAPTATTNWNGNQYSISGALDESRSLPESAAPATRQAYLDQVKHIADPKVDPKTKLGYFTSFFGPANKKLLDKFDLDTVDENGNKKDGKFSVFNRLSATDITNSAWELNKKYPAVWPAYKGQIENFFDDPQSGILPTIQSLESYAEPNLGGAIPKTIDLSWDNKTHQVSALIPGTVKDMLTAHPAELSIAQVARLPQLRQYITNLNQGLTNLAHVYSKDGGDLDEHLLTHLQKLEPELLNRMSGIPGKLATSILNSHAPDKVDDTYSPFDKKNPPVRMSPNVTPPTLPGIPTFRTDVSAPVSQ